MSCVLLILGIVVLSNVSTFSQLFLIPQHQLLVALAGEAFLLASFFMLIYLFTYDNPDYAPVGLGFVIGTLALVAYAHIIWNELPPAPLVSVLLAAILAIICTYGCSNTEEILQPSSAGARGSETEEERTVV